MLPRRDFDTIVRALFCGVVLIVCLWVTFSGRFPDTSVKIAVGFIGAILGYYLR